MKKVLLFIVMILIITGCNNQKITNKNKQDTQETIKEKEVINTMITIQITIQQQEFIAKFYDSPTTKQFIEMLPLTITMDDLNNNEKYYYFKQSFITKTENIKEIKNGDILLFQQNCLVLFYQNYQTNYSYTRLGYLENPEDLQKIVGNKSVEVKFQISEEEKNEKN